MAVVRPVFETSRPRDEVLKGKLTADLFAAKLSDVVEGRAPKVYQDPALFFQNTYPTEGLKTLLRLVMGRITGKGDGDPVIRLETSFGGGKTHGLIALYHIARHPAKIGDLGELLPRELHPTEPVAAVAIVGTVPDALKGFEHDGLWVRTLWGELAYQLRGPQGYELVREHDEKVSPPGDAQLKALFGEEPAIVMVDEVAHYLRAVRRDPDLGNVTVAFLHRLIEFAGSHRRLAVVLTLAESRDAYSPETEEVLESLKEAYKVSARQEVVLTPTQETEIAPVVNRRLFREIDVAAAGDTARAYVQYYRKIHERGAPIPTKATTAEYAKEIERSYPFHPELLEVLNRKLSTIPNFQRTRGVLRLVAHVIRQVWKGKEPDAFLIAPYHADLSVPAIRDELTGRLDKAEFLPVIDADLYSGARRAKPAHAQVIDEEWEQQGKPPFARRLGQTIFLHSLVHGGAGGADRASVILAVAQPDVDPDFLDQTLERMAGDRGSFWHLHYDGRRYVFKTEATLSKVVDEEMDNVGRTEAKKEVDRRLRSIYESKHFETVFFPEDPSEVDDDAGRPKLVVPHYETATVSGPQDPPPPLVVRLYERKGTQREFRTYQNNLVFLVANKHEVESLIQIARRYTAVATILGSGERLADFTREQQRKLQELKGSLELELRVAATRAYRHLFYPDAAARQEHHGLTHVPLKIQEAADAKRDQQAVLLQVLNDHQKVLTGGDRPVAPAFVRDKAWPDGTEELSTEEFRRLFAKRRGLPIVLDPGLIKRTILDGVRAGIWVYYDGRQAFHAKSPAPAVELAEDRTLYTTPRAEELGLLREKEKEEEKREERCPLCGQPGHLCECGKKPAGEIETVGVPEKAFQDLRDRAVDQGTDAVARLALQLRDVEELRRVALALGRLPGLQLGVEARYEAEADGDRVGLGYRGGWQRFSGVRSFLEGYDRQMKERDLYTVVSVAFDPPAEVGGEVWEQLVEALTALEVGKLTLRASPAGSPGPERKGG